MIDYILGRNTLIGVASFMLLIISGYATWHGMRDFIIGVSSTPTSQGQQLPGGMSFSNDFLVIAVVVALTFLMWLMLRETFGAKRHLRERHRHLPALRVPGDLVDRLRLRLLVEPDLRRGGDAHRALPACRRTRATPAPVVAARLDAVRGQLDSVVTLVGQPDGARGDERRQLRHVLGRRPRAALQCPAQRARLRSPPCATA